MMKKKTAKMKKNGRSKGESGGRRLKEEITAVTCDGKRKLE